MRWSDYIFEGGFWAHGACKRSKPIATSGAPIRGRRGEGASPDGATIDEPYLRAEFDFVLQPRTTDEPQP